MGLFAHALATLCTVLFGMRTVCDRPRYTDVVRLDRGVEVRDGVQRAWPGRRPGPIAPTLSSDCVR